MKVIEIEKVLISTVYEADDGTQFQLAAECEYYEFMEKQRKAKNVVFLVTERRNPSSEVEVFSTQELAEKSLENCTNDVFEIHEVVIDMRFIK